MRFQQEAIPLTPFNAAGDGYDMDTATAVNDYTETEGQPSIDPRSGMVLIGRRHSDWNTLVEQETERGHTVIRGDTGRYYSVELPKYLSEARPVHPRPEILDTRERAERDFEYAMENNITLDWLNGAKREFGTVSGLQKKIPFAGGMIGFFENMELIATAQRLQNPTSYEGAFYYEMEQASLFGPAPEWFADKDKWIAEQKAADEKTIADVLKYMAADKTWGHKVMLGVAALPTWFMEFAGTGGLAKMGDAVARKAGEKLLKQYAETTAGKVAMWSARIAAGGVLRGSVGLGHKTLETMSQRQLDVVLGIREEEGWATSALMAWGDTVIEAVSEEAGAGLTAGGGALLGKLPFGSKVTGALEKAWMTATGGSRGEFARKLLSKGGYSNFLGEIGEERLGTILRAITKADDFGLGNDASRIDRLKAGILQDWENIGVELGVLAVPTGAQFALGQVAKLGEGKEEFPTVEAPEFEDISILEQQGATQPPITPPPQAAAPSPIGKPYQATLYRGTSTEGALDQGLYGKATYYTPDKNVAEHYRRAEGRVVQEDVTLANPFVGTQGDFAKLDAMSQEERNQLAEQGMAQEQFDDLVATRMREVLESQGYDGFVLTDDSGKVLEVGKFAAPSPESLTAEQPAGGEVEVQTGKPFTARAYHGSQEPGLTLEFVSPESAVETEGTLFFTSNEDIASQFTFPREYGELVTEYDTGEVDEDGMPIYEEMEPGPIIEAQVSFQNPLVIEGSEAQDIIDDTGKQVAIVKKAKAEGYDGIILRDVAEFADPSTKGDVYAVFDKKSLTPAKPAPKAQAGEKAKAPTPEASKAEAKPAAKEKGKAEAPKPITIDTAETTKEIDDVVQEIMSKGGISARQANIQAARAALGLDGVASTGRRSWQQALQQAKNENLIGSALRIAAQLIDNPRPISDVETAGLVMKAAQLTSEHEAAIEKMDKAEDQADIDALSAEIDAIENEFNTLTTAIHESGSEKGRALAAQKLTINRGLDLLSLKARYKKIKGRALTQKETAKIEKMAKDLKLQQQQIALLEQKIAELMAKEHIRGGAVQRYARMTQAQRDSELNSLIDRTTQLLQEGCN